MNSSGIINILLSIHQNESQVQKSELEGALHTISLLYTSCSKEVQVENKPILQ